MSILRLENVTKAFGGVLAVKEVSLAFEEGKVSALIGPNGAGKTTVFNLISGLLHPDQGNIFYSGRKISGNLPWHIAQLGIGRFFQDARIFNQLSVLDNMLTAFKRQSGENVLIPLLLRKRMQREEKIHRQAALRLLEFVGLPHKAQERAADLSYGQQKLLALARLLAADMKVLLLDEPAAGVNPSTLNKIFDLVRNVAAEGKTVVIIEHNMHIVSECVDMVFFMEKGEVSSKGTPEVVLGSREVQKAYLGL